LPFYSPNTHFSGISFSYALPMLVKVSARLSICVTFFLLANTMSSM
jgi:hypothetical protein